LDDNDTDDGSTAARLRRLWATGDATGFYRLFYEAALVGLCRKLQQLLGLSETDADDCVATALDGFRHATDGGTVVEEPYAYIWASAHNAGITLHRQRQRDIASFVDYFATVDGQDPVEIAATRVAAARWAMVAVEETLDDVEVDESWAVTLVAAALEKLTDQSRRILQYLAEHPFDLARGDLDTSSEQAAATLGMTRVAFRKAKERAYSRLRAVIPATAVELGLILPPRYAEAILAQRPTIPSEEES
jgi:DNA-directed RNA polymerase specialized sigma24 family protein